MGEKDDQGEKGVWEDIQRQFWTNRLLKNYLKVTKSWYPDCLFMLTGRKQEWEGFKSLGLSCWETSTSKDSVFSSSFPFVIEERVARTDTSRWDSISWVPPWEATPPLTWVLVNWAGQK